MAIGFALKGAIENGHEWTTVILTAPVLVISLLTLWFAVPKRAKIAVNSLSELERSDLIFFIRKLPSVDGEFDLPLAYSLQLHIMISNSGAGKAIVTAVNIDGFKNSRSEILHLPSAPERINGVSWVQRSGWINHERHFENLNELPPYSLGSGEAIVIRFVCRRPIQWQGEWNVQQIKEFIDPLRHEIESALGTICWRRGGEIFKFKFNLNLKVEQQLEFVCAATKLTNDFSELPEIQNQPSTPLI